jgi:alpha/beta superfamily hydrolase
MPELIINGPGGRIEARYHHESQADSPIALILHPHPQFGGTMNNQVVYSLYHTFAARGFSVLRFNFRGVGRSQGVWDGGPGELADAASALDWLQLVKPDAKTCWIAGVSFGTWIAMQLLMRRPEIDGFICVAPPTNLYDFSFLAPCPSSGLMINGDKDRVVPTSSVAEMSGKIKTQKGIKITHEIVPGANHFFENKTEELGDIVGKYVDERMIQFEKDRAREKERERERERERQRQRELERMEAQSTPAASSGSDDSDDE